MKRPNLLKLYLILQASQALGGHYFSLGFHYFYTQFYTQLNVGVLQLCKRQSLINPLFPWRLCGSETSFEEFGESHERPVALTRAKSDV